MRKALPLLLLLIVLPQTDTAYETHDPIQIDGIHATAEEPYIIEGYEISNPGGTCIKVMNAENVIIRNNYLHDCGVDGTFPQATSHFSEGFAVLIGDSETITFENNKLDSNWRGFMAYSTEHLSAANNTITNTIQYSPLWCERCDHSEFADNYLSDNGDPEGFWVPGDRSIGIWVKRSEYVQIYGNTVIRSTSDGIAVTGQIYGPSFTVPDTFGQGPQDDWSGYSEHVRIHDNLILDNMEQGVWLVNGRDIEVYNNTIRTGCFTHGTAISTEFNVGESEFHHNRFLTCASGPPGGDNSFNIHIHNNIYYSWSGKGGDYMYFSEGELGASEAALRHGAPYEGSHDNREEGNYWVDITGQLADEMRQKKAYADEHQTYEAKGWFACELEDGTVDEACREQEEAKGNQGVPRKMLLYSSLMEDFDAFTQENDLNAALEEENNQEKDSPEDKEEEHLMDEIAEEYGVTAEDQDSLLDELIESWPATLIGFGILGTVGMIIVLRKRKRAE